jgi:hypothetical protein
MARSRNIKPGFFKNEVLGTADPLVGVLFVGLWCLADREGRLEDRPARIKAEIFPYRESLDINGYLTTLEKMCFIFRYEVDQKLILIPKFKKHQSPHHTEKKSELPPPNQEDSERLRIVTVNSPLDLRGNPPDSLIPDSLIPDSRKEKTPPFSQSDLPVQLPDAVATLQKLRTEIHPTLVWAERIENHAKVQTAYGIRVKKKGERAVFMALKAEYGERGKRSIAELWPGVEKRLDATKTEDFAKEKYSAGNF